MSKILIHSIAFSPDGVSTAYLYNDIATKFKDKGYSVVVLSTTPQFNIINEGIKKQPLYRRYGGLYYESNYNGINVKHVPQKKFNSTILRIFGFLYWHLVSFILCLFEKDLDIILSPSPPLTIGIINIIIGKLKGCKVIYNVQEIYPDLLIEGKKLKSKGAISILRWIEKFVYNKSDAVVTIDRIFYNTIADRFKDKLKLHIIPNFVDTYIYRPLCNDKIEVDRKIFPNNSSIKLMYAGNIGYAQDWDTLLNLAIKLREENVEYFIIGEGVLKDFLKREIQKHNLSKIHLIPYQSRESMPSLIAYSDLQFIFMSPQTEGQGFPSKVYTIMACAKPLLICSGPNTPITNFLENKKCAFVIVERNISRKTDQIASIIKALNKDELKEMGKNSLREINTSYTKDVVTDKYVNLVDYLLNPTQHANL